MLEQLSRLRSDILGEERVAAGEVDAQRSALLRERADLIGRSRDPAMSPAERQELQRRCGELTASTPAQEQPRQQLLFAVEVLSELERGLRPLLVELAEMRDAATPAWHATEDRAWTQAREPLLQRAEDERNLALVRLQHALVAEVRAGLTALYGLGVDEAQMRDSLRCVEEAEVRAEGMLSS